MPTVKGLSDATIIKQVIAARRESLESRRTKDAWARRAWDWYNNIHDFSNKEDWQSKLAIPKFAMAIDQAENFMRDGLRKSTRLFGIEVLNDDPVDKLLAAFLGTVMHEIVRVIGLAKQLPGSLKVALLTNQSIHKIGYEEFNQTEIAPTVVISQIDITDPETGTVIGQRDVEDFETQEIERLISNPTARHVDPADYYPDPRGMNLYEIDEVKQDLWNVIEKFINVADDKVLAALEADMSKGEPSADDEQTTIDKRSRQEIIEPENAFRRMVKLTDYYGPLFTDDGRLAAKRVRVVLANDKHILVRGKTYPFWDGEAPYVRYQGISVPFSVWGKLLVQHADSIQLYVNELSSLMMDKAKLSALGQLAVDTTLLEDIEDILTGIFPGKLWKTRGPNAVEEVNMSGVKTDHFQMYGLLSQEEQNAHAVTEFLQGQPTSRGRATLGEVEIKTQQGMQFFGGIVQNATDGLEKIFEKLFYRVMQFKDQWQDPAIAKIAARFGMTEVLGMLNDPMVRYRLMKRPFRFHAAGLNSAMRRMEVLRNLNDMLAVLGNLGPEFLQRVDAEKVFNTIIDAFDMDELLSQPSSNPSVIVPGDAEGLAQGNIPALQDGQLPPALAQGVKATATGRR